MATRPVPAQVRRSSHTIGASLATWRKLQGLTAAQLADRASISRSTLSRLENGDTGVGLEAFLNVSRALGILERLEVATDPFETDFGRARADEILPQRIRR